MRLSGILPFGLCLNRTVTDLDLDNLTPMCPTIVLKIYVSLNCSFKIFDTATSMLKCSIIGKEADTKFSTFIFLVSCHCHCRLLIYILKSVGAMTDP